MWAFQHWREALVLTSALLFSILMTSESIPRDILHAMAVAQWTIMLITFEDLLTRRVAGINVWLYFLYGSTMWMCMARLQAAGP